MTDGGDYQAAYESQWSLWPAILAHTNIVMHSVGWLEAGLVASYEKFILDCENLSMMHHFLQGFDTSPESLAVDAIAEVGIGGHHLDSPLTQANYKTAFYDPIQSSRENYEAWQAKGGIDAKHRANGIYKDILATYTPPPLDDSIREALNDFVARREEELQGVNLYG